MWWLALLTVLGACALATRRRRAPARAPPAFPGALPLLGHGHLFASGSSVDLWNLIKNIVETSVLWGGIVTFKLGPKQAYVISDPDDCMTVANSCFEKDYIYDFMRPAIGNGLLTADVPVWKVHRKLLTPAFAPVVLDGFLGVFNAQARGLVAALGRRAGAPPFDCWAQLGPNALETICLTAMGGAMADETLRGNYLDAIKANLLCIIQRFQRFWLHSELTYKFSSLSKKMEENSKIMHEVSNSVLLNKKRSLGKDCNEKSGSKFKAFIDLILECSGENGQLSDQEIREEVDTIIVAGHDTSATTLVYALVLLGSHPDVQERAFKEITEIVGDRDVEKEDLPKLVYVEAVLKETMRLYPIGPIVVRNLKEDVKLKNYTLPAGSGAYIAICALQRHAMWGADAGQFVPERWLDKARIPAHPAAFSAFSIGRRMCIGKTYALTSMKTTLAHIIRNFRVKADVSQLQLKLDVMLKPHSGHDIAIDRRTDVTSQSVDVR